MAIGGQGFCRLGDFAQRLEKFLPVGQRQGIEQRAFGPVGGVACTAQRLAARRADRHRVGAGIFLGTLARQQALFEHAAHHLCQGGAIDAGDLYQRRLADAFILFQRCQQHELLLGQFARAGFAGIEVAIELLAAADQVRRRFGQVKARPRLPLPLDHANPCYLARRIASWRLLQTLRMTRASPLPYGRMLNLV